MILVIVYKIYFSVQLKNIKILNMKHKNTI